MLVEEAGAGPGEAGGGGLDFRVLDGGGVLEWRGGWDSNGGAMKKGGGLAAAGWGVSGCVWFLRRRVPPRVLVDDSAGRRRRTV